MDALEAALLELEEADGSVTDSTVSVDFSAGRIEVEVFTSGQSLGETKSKTPRPMTARPPTKNPKREQAPSARRRTVRAAECCPSNE